MTGFKQTREILELAREFHGELRDFYNRLGDVAERRRVKFLLQYLSRHEERLGEILGRYESHASRKILTSWFQYVPDAPPFSHLGDLDLDPSMSVDDVVRLALQLDNALVEFYRSLADNSDSAEVREVFRSLLEMEIHDEGNLMRNAFTA